MDWKAQERAYFMGTSHRRLVVTLVRGERVRAWDDVDLALAILEGAIQRVLIAATRT